MTDRAPVASFVLATACTKRVQRSSGDMVINRVVTRRGVVGGAFGLLALPILSACGGAAASPTAAAKATGGGRPPTPPPGGGPPPPPPPPPPPGARAAARRPPGAGRPRPRAPR